MHKTFTYLFSFLLALPVLAEDAKKEEISKLQEAAPEALHLEVTTVRKKLINHRLGYMNSFTVKARITKVVRSSANLTEGTVIEFRYRSPDPARNTNQDPADYPAVLARGDKCEGFLKLGQDTRKFYVPAAESGSFVIVKEDKEES